MENLILLSVVISDEFRREKDSDGLVKVLLNHVTDSGARVSDVRYTSDNDLRLAFPRIMDAFDKTKVPPSHQDIGEMLRVKIADTLKNNASDTHLLIALNALYAQFR